MLKFRFLEHTADAKFQAFGRTLEEAFRNAALATVSLMWDSEKVEKKIKHRFRTSGEDQMQLLVSFLEEILYLMDTRNFLLASVESVHIRSNKREHVLEAEFIGDTNSGQYEIYTEVKAITYNDMKIEKNGRFSVQVVVDL